MPEEPTYEELRQRVRELERILAATSAGQDAGAPAAGGTGGGEIDPASVVDVPAIQAMMDDFHRLTNIGVAVLDLRGNVLVATGWQDICTRFHRVHPGAARNCRESDLELSDGVAPGTYKLYRCKNHMWDMATPIFAGGRKVANLYLGQFLFENEVPDVEVFRRQAEEYGFDEAAYLEALSRVPRWSRATVDAAMGFYTRLAGFISELGYRNLQLQRSEQRYRSLFLSSFDGIAESTLDGRLIACNPAYARMTGHTVEELLQLSYRDLTPPQWAEVDRRHVRQCLDRGYSDIYEKERIRKDGSVFPVSIRIWLRRDVEGRPVSLWGIVQDISERKRAEEALESERGFLAAVLDNIQDAIVICDGDGRLLRFNDAARRLHGVPEQPVPAERWAEHYDLYREDGRTPLAVAEIPLFRALQGERVRDQEIVVAPRNSRPRWMVCSGQALTGDGDRIDGAVVVMHDITGRKQAEEESERLQSQLAQAQKMESVGRLAGGVAHDFNNMLGVILGHTEMALEAVDPSDPLFEDLEEIRRAAARSADLTRQLLAFARKQSIAPRVIDLNRTVAGMLKMLLRLIGEDIELSWQPAEGLWPVRMDPSQIDQVLANLCVNARDAVGQGGAVAIRTRNETVDEAGCAGRPDARPGAYVVLAVSDDGRGMDRETLARLYEPFFTTKALGRGTGLGLATVYGIVRQNEGFIHTRSAPGRGATFEIFLPRHREAGEALRSDGAAAPEAVNGHETVLLVEDEPAILKMTAMMLERLGYRVLTAAAPVEALRLAETRTDGIELLMTDVVMPGMNGRDLARKLMTRHPGLRCLFMSGYTANVIAHHGVLDRGVHYIQKPFSRSELAASVRAALERGPGGLEGN